MPVHIKTVNGSIIAGQLSGQGEIYFSDEKGNGEIYKGNFIRGKLNDPDGIYINYTNSSFNMFRGTFVDNAKDGSIELLSYFTLDVESEEEKNCEGNSFCKTNGNRFIHASKNQLVLTGVRKIVIYSNDTQMSTLSEDQTALYLLVNQKILNGRKIFSDFRISTTIF